MVNTSTEKKGMERQRLIFVEYLLYAGTCDKRQNLIYFPPNHFPDQETESLRGFETMSG